MQEKETSNRVLTERKLKETVVHQNRLMIRFYPFGLFIKEKSNDCISEGIVWGCLADC